MHGCIKVTNSSGSFFSHEHGNVYGMGKKVLHVVTW